METSRKQHPCNLLMALQNAFTQHKSHNAFCIDDNYFTYEQLGNEVNKLRTSLQEVPDEHIGLVANNDLSTYAAIFALWMEGKSYVPLHPLQPLKRCLDIVGQVGIKTIIDSSNETRYTEIKVIRAAELKDKGLPTTPPATFDARRLAYILFTSGSTGRPKGVCITLGNVAAFVDSMRALGLRLDENDRCLQMFDLTFDMSVGSYLQPLLSGACLYTVGCDRIKWQEALRLMEDYRLTEAHLVPSVIHYLKPYFSEIHLPDMRFVYFAGEGLPADDVAGWKKCLPNAEVWNVYGPTENTVYSTGYLIPATHIQAHNGIVGIGKALKNSLIQVIDDDGKPIGKGEQGELCLAGEQLTAGYWRNEEQNTKAFFEQDGHRWYRTGDVCSRAEDGNLIFHGRCDSQVQIQGYRVELSEIEQACREFYAEKVATVAIAHGTDTDNTRITLVVETADSTHDRQLMQYLSQYLPHYMLPSDIVHLAQFPQNASNKIDRKRIAEMIKNKHLKAS